ncbi:amidohydrolase family protein [Streptomyces nogalater]
MVTSGFTDGHLHPVSGAERTMGVDLSGCRDLAAVRAALAAAVRDLRPGAWLRGWGLDPNAFGTAPVATAALAPVLDGVPALIDLFDAHSALASERALELAGVDGPRAFEQGSEIVCDADGRPTGLLLEDAACEVVEAVAPGPPRPSSAPAPPRCWPPWPRPGSPAGTPWTRTATASPSTPPWRPRAPSPAAEDRPWCRPEASDADLAELVRLQGTGGALWRVAG